MHPDTWVFWVHASNAERFQQAYLEIATKLAIPELSDPKADVLRLVYDRLNDEAIGRWLMILDNADDAKLFFDRTSTENSKSMSFHAPLARYLPQSPNGSILITSRDGLAAFRLVGEQRNILNVGPMDEKDGMSLLRTKMELEPQAEPDAKRLLQNLGYIPLAITQAAAYINMRATRMTIRKYLDMFQENEANRTKLLDEDSGDLRRDPGVPNAVITAWEISFDQIRKDRPSAAALLSLMSVFDPQGIPESLLSGICDSRLGFEDAVASLINFSLITAELSRQTFDMHPLVQLATRKWLRVHGELGRWQEQSINIISQILPEGNLEDWKFCEALEPHVHTVLRYECTSQHGRLDRAQILHNSSWYARKRGYYDIARAKIEEATTTRTEMLGPENEDTLKSLRTLALVLRSQALWEEAEKLFNQIVEVRTRILGENHSDTLGSMSDLARVYRRQGRWKKAETLGVEIIKKQKKALGAEHSDTLISMSGLASTYFRQGRLNEAAKLFVQVLETQKRVLGEEDQYALISMGNLVTIYGKQERFQEAENLALHVLEIRNRVWGQEHPHTLSGKANLALIYSDQERWKEAEEIQIQLLELDKRKLGKDHPKTLTTMLNLAITWKNLGYKDKALELLAEAVQLSKVRLGVKHPDTEMRIRRLDRWLKEDGQVAKSQSMDSSAKDQTKERQSKVWLFLLALFQTHQLTVK